MFASSGESDVREFLENSMDIGDMFMLSACYRGPRWIALATPQLLAFKIGPFESGTSLRTSKDAGRRPLYLVLSSKVSSPGDMRWFHTGRYHYHGYERSLSTYNRLPSYRFGLMGQVP